MPIALDPSKTWDYILQAERGEATPTTFTLKALTVADEAELQDRMVAVEDGTTRVLSGTHTLDTLRKGLVGWHSFRFADGTAAPYATDPGRRMRDGRACVSDAALALLTPAVRKELAEAIIERNTITEAERKNSSSVPAS